MNHEEKTLIRRNCFGIKRDEGYNLLIDSIFGILLITSDLLGSLFVHKNILEPDFHTIRKNGRLHELKQEILEFLNYEKDGTEAKYEYSIQSEENKDFLHKPSVLFSYYVPLDRTGQSFFQLAMKLHHIILTSANPFEVGKILSREIENNESPCRLDSLLILLQHDFQANSYLNNKKPFSVGLLQGPYKPRDEYGFVLYANLSGHVNSNISGITCLHNYRNAHYLRIAFRFMD